MTNEAARQALSDQLARAKDENQKLNAENERIVREYGAERAKWLAEKQAIEAKLHRLKAEIAEKNEAFTHYRTSLAALHYVWCNGGCEGGVSNKEALTEEVLAEAIRQVERMVTWYRSYHWKAKFKALDFDFQQQFLGARNELYTTKRELEAVKKELELTQAHVRAVEAEHGIGEVTQAIYTLRGAKIGIDHAAELRKRNVGSDSFLWQLEKAINALQSDSISGFPHDPFPTHPSSMSLDELLERFGTVIEES